ncbi:MAG: hypothetical protein LBE36_14220 [Flavobacteriaceae bacterium]|jgi:hypothetical protein|nr:hypothetical protein [Flavobacteriaceae bacterium]
MNFKKFLYPKNYLQYAKKRLCRTVKSQKNETKKQTVSYKYIVCDARELFFQQKKENKFNRYDIIVRYLAIENFYEKNDFGFDLYKKMQINRVGNGRGEKSTEKFKELIYSYEKNGYDSSSEIELYADLHLIDGSHRIALALYHEIYEISCKVRSDVVNIFYGIEWFIEKGFSVEEIKKIQEKYEEIVDNITVPFVCTLWSPVQNYFDEITEKLSLVTKVVDYRDYSFDDYTYSAMVKGIYAVDDIADWKIDMKIDKMQSNAPKKMRMILLNIGNPVFRLKSSNDSTLSSTCEVLKKMIRNAYKDKVENYFHDTIMHIGDNYHQNIFIRNLFNVSIDVNDNKMNLLMYLDNYIERGIINKNDICIVGSYIMENAGLRKANDIDIVCRKNIRENLKIPFNRAVKLNENVEMVTYGWAAFMGIIDDELIDDEKYHTYVDGYKIANLDILKQKKLYTLREKDILDLALLGIKINNKK